MKRNLYRMAAGNVSLSLLAALFLLPAQVRSQEKTTGTAVSPIKCNLSGTPVTVDGIGDDWETNRLPAITRDTLAGCYKDEEFFYFHILTTNREFSMQLMNFGLTVWLDPSGSGKKTTGVQFPVIQLQPPPPKEGGKPPRGKELKDFLNKRMRDIIIEFPASKEMKQLSAAEAKILRIEASIGVDEKKGAICYELKYPLVKSTAAAGIGIDLAGQKNMDICVETPEIDPSKLKGKFEKQEKSTDTAKVPYESEQEMRPPKGTEETKPPKPTKKPPMGRISQWIKAIF